MRCQICSHPLLESNHKSYTGRAQEALTLLCRVELVATLATIYTN